MKQTLPLEDWLKLTKESAAKELAPFTKDDTRKQGRTLTWMSFIIILLSFKIFEITQGSAFGITGKATSSAFVSIAMLVTLYLFVLYIIDLYADWNSRPYSEFDKFRDELEGELIDNVNEGSELSDRILKLIELRKQKQKELGLSNENLVETDVSKNATKSIENWKLFMEEIDMENENHRLLDEYCKNDGLDELQKKYYELAFENPLVKKAKIWVTETKKIYRVYYFRFLSEIIFPSLLAMIGVTSSIIYLVNKR